MNKILFLCFPRELKLSPIAQHSLISLKNKILNLSSDQGSNYYKTKQEQVKHLKHTLILFMWLNTKILDSLEQFAQSQNDKKILKNGYFQMDKIYVSYLLINTNNAW